MQKWGRCLACSYVKTDKNINIIHIIYRISHRDWQWKTVWKSPLSLINLIYIFILQGDQYIYLVVVVVVNLLWFMSIRVIYVIYWSPCRFQFPYHRCRVGGRVRPRVWVPTPFHCSTAWSRLGRHKSPSIHPFGCICFQHWNYWWWVGG